MPCHGPAARLSADPKVIVFVFIATRLPTCNGTPSPHCSARELPEDGVHRGGPGCRARADPGRTLRSRRSAGAQPAKRRPPAARNSVATSRRTRAASAFTRSLAEAPRSRSCLLQDRPNDGLLEGRHPRGRQPVDSVDLEVFVAPAPDTSSPCLARARRRCRCRCPPHTGAARAARGLV